MYNVDGVMIDVGVQSDKAAAGLEKLAATLGKVKTAAAGNVGLENVRKQIEGTNNSLNKFKGFTRSLVSIAAVTRLISASVTKSNEYVESLNLFRVALGGYADEAERYAKTVEDVMGIDSSEWMRNQGTFMQIASGFGMAADQAYTLSKALTQVSYDIASFYNISTKEAMSKVRSGISGELEPLRNLGYALDTATLQQIAYANGITQKVNTMTQAQKAELRYVAIMTQSKNAINDMSRTFNTSANQIRVLTGQINVLARAFGNILIPAINAVLPIVIAFVNTLSAALNAIANLFGFAIPSVDWGSSGLSDASGAASDLNDNLGGATGSASKLKKVLMGFDELNVMPDVGGGGGGGGGGSLGAFGGSLGLELEDYMYDFLDGMYSKVKKLDGKLLGLVAGVAGLAIPAATMLGWKNLSNIIGGMVTAFAQFELNFELTRAFLESGDSKYIIMSTGITSLAGGILTTIFRNAGMTKNGTAWRYGFGTALAIDVGATLYAMYESIKESETDPFDETTIITGITNIAKGALIGYLTGGVSGALIGIALSTSATLSVIALAVDKREESMLYGNVELSAEEIRLYAQSLLNVEVDPTISLINTTVNGVAEAQAQLDSAIASLKTSANIIQLGIDTSVEAYTALKNDALAVISGADNLLTAQERTLAVMLSLSDPTDEDGKTMDEQLLSAATNASAALKAGYEGLGGQLMDAIQRGMDTGEFEAELIAELSNALVRVSSAMAHGEITGNYTAGVSLALADLDKKSFDSVLAEIETARNDLRNSYTELVTQERTNLVSQLSGLKELQAVYYEMGDIDAGNALQITIDNLEAQIKDYNIPARVEQMMANTLVNDGGVIADALAEWIGRDNNGTKFAGSMDDFFSRINAAFINAAKTGDYDSMSEYTAQAIEQAFKAKGVDLSTLNLTGADFVSEEFRGVIDEAFRKAEVSQDVIDIFWAKTANNPNWEKSGVIAAQKSIEAIKAQYNKTEPDAREIANNFADNLAKSYRDIDYDAMISEEWGDYSYIAQNIADKMNNALAKEGIDVSQLGISRTELLTEELRSHMGNALKNAGIPQGSIDAIWNEFSRIFGNGIVTSITDSKTGAVTAIGTVINALKAEAKKNTIKFKLGLTSDGSSATISGGGVNKSVNIVMKYASGGMPEYGSMFIAGESGPELVGQIGNRTGVVNSGQISEIIAAEMARNGNQSGNEDAVANAVASALNNMELKVDGDSFGRIAVKTINKRRQTSGRVELIL